MKTLILFSLKRKLFNNVMILMMVLVFFVVGGIFFVDKAIDVFFPNLFAQTNVFVFDEMKAYLDLEDTKFVVSEEKDANIHVRRNNKIYEIEVDQSISENDVLIVQSWIKQFHQLHESQFISQEISETIDYLMMPTIDIKKTKYTNTEQGFIIITMIYFLMLGFSSTVANEVVSEKTTNMLEMMLTSVSYKEHYIAKLLIGWITLFSQLIIWLTVFIGWFVVRLIYDQGIGLYNVLFRLQILKTNYSSFFDHFSSLSLSMDTFAVIFLSVVFLIIGILFVQLLLLLVSINIENIEESASVQAPFYLLMLGLYYGTLAINSYQHMQLGLGKILSFLPGFSMLLVPIRLLYYDMNYIEIIVSFIISISFLLFGYMKGFIYYKQSITGAK